MAQLVVEVIERGIAQTEQKINKLGQTAEKTSEATDGLGQTAGKTSAAADKLGQTAGKTSAAIDKLGQTADKTSAATNRLGQTAEKTSTATGGLGQTAGKTSAATDGLSKSTNNGRFIMQQFGYQLQDVIVTTRDAASGLSAIGVQGGQFLSMITPLGGTLLTIAGIAGGALLGSLSESTDQTRSLSDAMATLDDQLSETEDGAIRLSDSLTKLANKNERLARTELTRSLLAASDALDEIREQSNEIIDNNIGGWFSDGSDTARQLAYEIERIDSSGQDLYTVIAQLQEVNAFSPLASAAEDLQEKLGITRLESVELLRALALAAKNPTPEAFERVGVTLEELNKQSGFSNKALLQLAEKFSELQLKATTATERLKFAKEAITNFGQAVKDANDDMDADEARREAEREQRRRESAARRAAIEAEQEARRRALLEASAQKTLQDIERLGATESQILGYWYEDNLAKLEGYLSEGLITRQEYALAQEQLLNESVERQLAIDERLNEQRRSAERQRTEEVRREVEAQYRAEEEAAREKERQFDRAADAQASLTNQLGATLGKQNAIYKASAIMTATIDTYKAATGAYASLSSIPVVGPALGAAAAGAAIGFGMAQIKAITSTPNRAQGGDVTAGTPYMVGERGREVFVPSTSGTIVPSSGIGGTMVNVTVIDRSTNGGNAVAVRQLTERDVEIIIEDRVPSIMAREQSDPYSRFSKAQRASTTTGRRF